jgi:hypothetical protein
MREFVSQGDAKLQYEIVVTHEQDGSWTATIDELGVRATAAGDIESRAKAQAQALRMIADQIETDHSAPDHINFGVRIGSRLPLIAIF